MLEVVHGDEELAVVNTEHVKRISDTFRPIKGKKRSTIPRTVVQEIWKNRLAPRFFSTMMNVMFPENSKEVSFLSFYTIYKNLAEPEAEIMFRALTIYHIATIHEPPFNYEQADEYPNAQLKNIKDYVCDVITSYLQAIIHMHMKEALGWLDLRASNSLLDGNLVAAYLLKDLEAHRNEVSIGSLEIWLEKNEIYYTVSEQLYLYLFGVSKSLDVKALIPYPLVQNAKNSRTLLSLPDVLLLNSKLPKRAPRWTLAFMLDSRKSGDWEKFKKIIYGRGRTLIVIQDGNGDIFGMYGPQQWLPSTGFFGNDQSFLFTLKPDVNVYESSGRNNNYQVFTDSGIGMGGTDEHYGLFINYGAKTGLTSHSCATFRQFWPLAQELDFNIEQLELWIVNEDPVADWGEIITTGANDDQENNLDLLSENLETSKQPHDFLKTEITEAQSLKIVTEHDNVVKETIEETNTKVTTAVQEALQKQIKQSNGEQCRQGISTRNDQSCGDKSIGLVKDIHRRSCVQKNNTDLLRSPIAEARNVKTPFKEKGSRGFVHPSEGQGVGINHKGRPRSVSDGGFFHPSLKPKREPSLILKPKNQDGRSSPDVTRKNCSNINATTEAKVCEGTTKGAKPWSSHVQERRSSEAISEEKKYHSLLSTTKKNTNDVTFIKYPLKRNGKSLIDVQVQVGESKLLRPCRMSSNKYCACFVKSPCNCNSVMPMSKNMSSGERSNKRTFFSEYQSRTAVYDSTTNKLPSTQTLSIIAPDNNPEKIQSTSKFVNIVSNTTITEKLPTTPLAVVSQIEIDSKGTSSTESCSAAGCRCSSSTETSSDCEEGGTSSAMDRLKLKSECSCQFNKTVLSDPDVASKCISDAGCTVTKTLGPIKEVNKLKEASSSMCSCVLGPKDPGVANSSQEKVPMATEITISNNSFSSKKETQELTRSNRKTKISLGCEESKNLSKFITSTPSDITQRFLRSSNKKEKQSSARLCKHSSSVSLESAKRVQLSIPTRSYGLGPKPLAVESTSQEKPLLPTDDTDESCFSSRSCRGKNILLGSGGSIQSSSSMSPTFQVLSNKEKTPTCSSQDKLLLSTNIANNSKHFYKNETLYLTESSKKSDTSWKSTASTQLGMPLPPTCLNCRRLVETTGCQCKTRASPKLVPILEQAPELLQQRKLSERSSILKSERHSNNSLKDITITENPIVSRSKDILQAENTNSAKKSCQCSLPRSCFPQFPEDHIQVDDGMKKCGCGTHAGTVIRFPTFPEHSEEDLETVNVTYASEIATASEVVSDTEGSSKGKKGKGECPCIEEDGTIIILNVSKCNTMEALEKIVRELDIKYHPVMQKHFPSLQTTDFSTKSKPCNAAEAFDRDAIKRLLDSKMMGPPKEQSEPKSMSMSPTE